MTKRAVSYEPVNVALPLAKKLEESIKGNGELPNGAELRRIVKEIGGEELYLGRGVSAFRAGEVVGVILPGRDRITIELLPSEGGISEALEVVAYMDRDLGAFVVEILPANDIEYEGNIGLEPVIIDAGSLELKSTPVLGEFEEEEEGVFLVIDLETYGRWKESGKLGVCPICGGKLVWEGEKTHCADCGYGVKVKN
ncbi:hypothetical protein [Thermococcus sp. Bubb.Bath]|uniref:hypothetical protein n=1 Tax=Thermococcus sp. Bubb.Bath TaxID=1638242 RepID=UPI00143B395C|nr:hypothetical protein [Thermococcus sp. Bubb.Bath]NJF25094.1 hypothetical protein [Thermococcus sp. Bubb.Bath]